MREAIERLDISYPVAIDNDFKTWRAFGNRYWPSLYLIDKGGIVRHRHLGELHVGSRDWVDLEERIERLLRD